MDLSPELMAVIAMGLFGVSVLSGVPVAFSMLGVGAAIGFLFRPEIVFDLMAAQALNWVSNYVMLIVPLVVFMGHCFARICTYSPRGPFTGGAESPTMPANAITATMATAALIGAGHGAVRPAVTSVGSMFPAIPDIGQDTKTAAAIIGGGSSLGILLPPSIVLVLYAIITEESVGMIYIAALVPSLLVFVLFAAVTRIQARRARKAAKLDNTESTDFLSPVRLLWRLILLTSPIALMLLIIWAGIATPVEAAALGAVICVVLTMRFGVFSVRSLQELLLETLVTTSAVLWLVIAASLFLYFAGFVGWPSLIAEFLTAIEVSPWAIVAILLITVLLLGWVLNAIEVVVIVAPIIAPTVNSLGFDALWFGALFALTLMASQMIPPVGSAFQSLNSFSWAAGYRSDLVRGCLSFVGVSLVVIVLVFIFPELALWLPDQNRF